MAAPPILLIRPPAEFRNRPFPDGPRIEMPLGLLSIAASIERAGLTVRLLDAQIEPDLSRRALGRPLIHFGAPWERIAETVRACRPRLIGINNAFTDHLPYALRAAEVAKAAAPPGAIVAVGGAHATVAPADLFRLSPHVDVTVAGEGEECFATLARAVADGRAPNGIPGIVARGAVPASGGTSPRPALVEDLDSLPCPAYGLYDLERLFRLNALGFGTKIAPRYPGSHRRATMVTSRGCPFRCVFCDAPRLTGGRWRGHSPDYVLGHIERLVREWDVRHVHFNDDNLTVRRDRFEAILDGLERSGPAITWDTPNGVRADDLDGGLIERCKRAGCAYLLLGIESGDQAVLDRIVGKQLDLGRVEEVARECARAGLDLHAFYMIGFPGETREAIGRTIALARRLLGSYGVVPHLNVAEPHVGSALRRRAEELGQLTEPLDPARRRASVVAYTHPLPYVRTEEFDPGLLFELRDRLMGWALRRLALRALALAARHPLATLRMAALAASDLARRPWDPSRAARAALMGTFLFARWVESRRGPPIPRRPTVPRSPAGHERPGPPSRSRRPNDREA